MMDLIVNNLSKKEDGTWFLQDRKRNNAILFKGSQEQCDKVANLITEIHNRAVRHTIKQVRRLEDGILSDTNPIDGFPVYQHGKKVA